MLTTYLGLLLEPGYTTRKLLPLERPPYGTFFLLVLAATIFAPLVTRMFKLQAFPHGADVVISIVAFFFFSLLIFFVLEGMFLQLIGVNPPLHKLYASVGYSVTPLITALCLIYLFNYLATSDLSLVDSIITGYPPTQDKFLKIIPIAVIIAQLNVFLVFFHCVRVLGDMQILTGLLATLLSLFPLYLSIIVGALIANAIRPGTIGILLELLGLIRLAGG